MRIKRFIANDIRTALSMVRQEQGADAVILSNRSTPEGIEIVSATDYDESLMQQALRTAAPAPAPAPAPTVAVTDTAVAKAAETAPAPAPAATATRADAMIAAVAAGPAPREKAPRPRLPFGLGGRTPQPAEPTLAELAATAPPPAPVAPVAPPAPSPAPVAAPAPSATPMPTASAADAADAGPTGEEFRALLARLTASEARAGQAGTAPTPAVAGADATPGTEPSPAAHGACGDDAPVAEPGAPRPARSRALHAVADEDPALTAMRGELAAMRQLIERQSDALAIERLRGSPARAAAFEALLGYGCDEAFAQTLATRIDPRMDPAQVRTPMFEALARSITINRAEPIDDGGVIALVGPTGAGKTTTVAKLAARFAARHRARDVALVTTDSERVGAREQLHAHGRRLGITVCEADGPEALNQTLDQLVDYPLVLVDTAGYAARDSALLGQILWLRTARRLRSLLVLPANANPHDLNEVVRRYRPATSEGVVLTKTDETGRLGAALSVVVGQGLSLAYTTSGQQVPGDIEVANANHLVLALQKLRRAADNPFATEDRHAVA